MTSNSPQEDPIRSISVSMRQSLLDQLDALAASQGRTRSNLVARLVDLGLAMESGVIVERRASEPTPRRPRAVGGVTEVGLLTRVEEQAAGVTPPLGEPSRGKKTVEGHSHAWVRGVSGLLMCSVCKEPKKQ